MKIEEETKKEWATRDWSRTYKRLAHRLEGMDEESCKKALAYLLGHAEYSSDDLMKVMEKALNR